MHCHRKRHAADVGILSTSNPPFTKTEYIQNITAREPYTGKPIDKRLVYDPADWYSIVLQEKGFLVSSLTSFPHTENAPTKLVLLLDTGLTPPFEIPDRYLLPAGKYYVAVSILNQTIIPYDYSYRYQLQLGFGKEQ